MHNVQKILYLLLIPITVWTAEHHSAKKESQEESYYAPVGWVTCIAIDPVDASNIYVGSFFGIYKSCDYGESWHSINDGLESLTVNSIAIGKEIYAATDGGLFVAKERGESWTKCEELKTIFVQDVVMDERSTVYVADLCKVWISRDGERWRMVKDGFDMITDIHILDDTLYLVDYTKGVFEYDGTSWKHLGLSGMGARSLAIDPRDRERIYVATENGFMMSVDSGNSWQEQNRGLTTRDLQVVKVADRIYLGSLLGGFFVSKDGKRWSPENIGLLNTNIHCLAVDWKEPERIYLGTEDGVYKRDGERWRKASDGLVRIAPPPLPKDPEAVRERKRRMGITAPPAEGAHGGGH